MMGPRSVLTQRMFILLGHVLFAGLLVLAWMHYKERVIHVDSALQIFKWVQKPGVEVEAYRFSAVFPQLVVKLVRLASPSLELLLRMASVAHVLVPYAVFLLAAHAWRVHWVAVATVLAAVLGTRLTFYGIVLEANYLLSYPLLLAAAVEGPLAVRPGRRAYLMVALALALVLLVHPVGFLLAVFVLAFLFLLRAPLRPAIALLMIAAVAWGLLGRMLLPPSGYEQGLYVSALEGVVQLFRFRELPAVEFLVGHTWNYTTLYLPLWCLGFAVLAALLFQRRYALFALVLTGTVGYAMLNILTYHVGETAMMMEKNFLPLATMVALPAAWLLWERPKAWLLVPYILVLFVQFRGISFAVRPMQERQQAVAGLVNALGEREVRKAVLDASAWDPKEAGVVWALPFETILWSALSGPEHTRTAVYDPEHAVVTRDGVYLPPWNTDVPAEALNGRYFSLPSGSYQRISAPLGP